MTTTAPAASPQQLVLQRLVSLHAKVAGLATTAGSLLEQALNDAVTVQAVETPSILTEQSLADLTKLRTGLDELVNHYHGQMQQLSHAVVAAASPAPAAQVKADPAAAREALRERVSLLAIGSEPPAKVEPAAVEQPLLPAAHATTEGGLPSPIPLQDGPRRERPPLAPVQVENSLMRLLGESSPLLEIFSPGPWLPDGKGTLTVGSAVGKEVFQWYKRTDPMDRSGVARAQLPIGFYAGDERPKYALLRLKSTILVWDFGRTPESISAYIVGLSDADPSAQPRWFHPSELSASFTRKLVQELIEFNASRI